MATKNRYPRTFHVLESGLTVNLGDRSGGVLYRGEVFTVTEQQYEFTKNKHGVSWLDMTPEEQDERWGVQRFGEGEAPADIGYIGSDDSTVRFRRRENAVIAARKITDDAERKKAFAEINATYGPAESTQTSQAY